MKAHDLEGCKFGRLTVTEFCFSLKKKRVWLCQCDCGNWHFAVTHDLLSGHTKSCGCYRAKGMRKPNAARRHPLFALWCGMRQRCCNVRHVSFPWYGGRGIRVCPEWSASFWQFVRDVGERPAPGLSLDRIDPDDDYRPGNVRWATPTEQQRNKRPKKPPAPFQPELATIPPKHNRDRVRAALAALNVGVRVGSAIRSSNIRT